MCAVSRVHDTIRSSTRRLCAQSYGPRGLATCTYESSEACAMRDAILRTWGGAIARFVDSPTTCRRRNSTRGYRGLIKLARQKRSALMCAEAVPWRCHRSLIADALIVRGIRVEDIMNKNRSQLHSMTSFARVRRRCITYPGYKDDRLLSSDIRTAPKEKDSGSPRKNDATI
jgi:hypothetical protein